jgi:serine protease inhibitor
MTDTKNLFLGKIDHTVRVAVDEAGVIAAAYTVMDFLLNSGFPTNEEIDFVLDRPFLFVVSSHDQLPLITGVVEQP